MRQETDFIGSKEISDSALFGIHSVRAVENFPNRQRFNINWYKSIGIVKLSVYKTYVKYKSALLAKYDVSALPFTLIADDVIKALIKAAEEVSQGMHYDNFIVPAITGGAGTSQNMNVNEIIANRALILLGHKPGEYDYVHPIEHANIYQSTNDVIPTALKVALMQLLKDLENSINQSRQQVEALETKYRSNLRIAYTQMQAAVPSTYGRLFGAYNEALSRDWWRVSKCFERTKQINLGGSAVGTGLTVPRYFIMETVNELRSLTELPLSRSENLTDTTQNLDSFVEVSAILKSHAVNLEKIAGDLRLLASDIIREPELTIPQKQAGSSIMPGKVNPVICEFGISAAHKVYANDSIISSLSALGCLDLNAYLPSIGDAILESVELLIAANQSLTQHLFNDIQINTELSLKRLLESPSISTALLPYIGYEKAGLLAKEMKESCLDIFDANKKLNLIREEKLAEILKPENLIKEGFSIKDIL
ncbi:MAG: lyase family protein [bacterium]